MRVSQNFQSHQRSSEVMIPSTASEAKAAAHIYFSRAQHGMYIIGDSQTARPIDMWAKVLRILEEKGNIGPTLELQCLRHPDTPIHVACADDFNRLAPEGGCSERCGKRLTCGHVCLMKCHSNQLHEL